MTGRTLAIVQSRYSSTRLPGKAMLDLCGRPVLAHVVARLREARTLDGIVVATGDSPANQPILDLCERLAVDSYVGPEDDVLARFVGAAERYKATVVVRVTGDCPLVSGRDVDRMVRLQKERGLIYLTNFEPPTWPDGTDLEVITAWGLRWANEAATLDSQREHVTPFLRANLKAGDSWDCWRSPVDLSAWRLCIDEPSDLAVLRTVMEACGPDCTWRAAIRWLQSHPEVTALNGSLERNASYLRQLKEEQTA